MAITPDTLIISTVTNPTITICGQEIVLTGKPLLTKVMGMEVWLDETLPKGKAILIDSKTAFKVPIEDLGGI